MNVACYITVLHRTDAFDDDTYEKHHRSWNQDAGYPDLWSWSFHESRQGCSRVASHTWGTKP